MAGMNRPGTGTLMKTVFFIALLAGIIFCSTTACAITPRTPEQIRAWLDNEKASNMMHGNGDCTDFVNDYLTEFWETTPVDGHAKAWGCPAGFTEINLNGNADLLQIGDIIQEDYGSWGHVCVYYGKEGSKYMVVDQATDSYATPKYHQWWDVFGNPTRVFRGPTDTEPPVILDVYVEDVSGKGYTVTCRASDNVGVTRILFPTWTDQNGKDDLPEIWPEGRVWDGISSFRVKVSDHNNERNCLYYTHVYVYDAAGNEANFRVEVNVPELTGSEMLTCFSSVIPDGDYLIVPAAEQSMFLDIYGSDLPAENGTRVTLWERDGEPGEHDIWTITCGADGYYTIRQKNTGMCLDVIEDNDSKLLCGTGVQVWESTGASNQQWAIVSCESGYILQARCSGFCLDIAGGTFDNDAKIRQYEINQSDAQIWAFIPYENGQLADSPFGTDTSANEPTPEPTTEPTDKPSGKKPYDPDIGPVLISGDLGHFTLYQLNITTGEKNKLFDFWNDNIATSAFKTEIRLDIDYIPHFFLRQLFSPDMEKIAVRWYEGSDGSYHVGWLNMKTDILTDVTNIVHPASSGFSALVPNDTNALFSPDGYFFFCDDQAKKCVYVDIDTLTVVRETDYPVIRTPYGETQRAGMVFQPNGELRRNDTKRGAENYTYYHVDDTYTLPYSNEIGYRNVKAFDAIDEVSLCGICQGDEFIYYVAKYGKGVSEPNETYHRYDSDMDSVITITPKTSYKISDCVCHNGNVIFAARLGGNPTELFITDLDGSGEPAKIGDLPNGMKLLFWR